MLLFNCESLSLWISLSLSVTLSNWSSPLLFSVTLHASSLREFTGQGSLYRSLLAFLINSGSKKIPQNLRCFDGWNILAWKVFPLSKQPKRGFVVPKSRFKELLFNFQIRFNRNSLSRFLIENVPRCNSARFSSSKFFFQDSWENPERFAVVRQRSSFDEFYIFFELFAELPKQSKFPSNISLRWFPESIRKKKSNNRFYWESLIQSLIVRLQWVSIKNLYRKS